MSEPNQINTVTEEPGITLAGPTVITNEIRQVEEALLVLNRNENKDHPAKNESNANVYYTYDFSGESKTDSLAITTSASI